MRLRPHPRHGGRILWVIAGIIFVLAKGATFPVRAQTQDQGIAWSTPIPLSNIVTSSWFPGIAADISGRLHVVWSSTVEQQLQPGSAPGGQPPAAYDVVEYVSSQDGVTWTSPNEIVAFRQQGGNEATRPSLLADPDGMLHLAMRDFDVEYSRAAIVSASDASSWSSPVNISTNRSGYYSTLAQDPLGNMYMAFTQNVPTPNCPSCFHLLVRSSTDGGDNWSSLTDVSILPQGAVKPQLAVDPERGIHVVWEAGLGGGLGQVQDPTTVMHSQSEDGGKTWSLPYDFPSPEGRARNISIAVDGDGRLLVAWLALPSAQIYSSVSEDNGLSWSTPFPINGIAGYNTVLDDTTMATDSAGNVHLVAVGWVDVDHAHLGLFHFVWNAKSSTWSTPDLVSEYAGDAPEWPRLAISEGNKLNLVWYVRDQAHIFDSSRGRYQVWFAQSAADAPRIPPGGLPTPTATANLLPATGTPDLATPTAAPDLSGTNATLALQPVQTEDGVLVLMLKSLALPIAVLLVMLAFVRLKR